MWNFALPRFGAFVALTVATAHVAIGSPMFERTGTQGEITARQIDTVRENVTLSGDRPPVLGAIDPSHYPIPNSEHLVLSQRGFGSDIDFNTYDDLVTYVSGVLEGVPDKTASFWSRNHHTIATYSYRGESFIRYSTLDQDDAERLLYQDMDDINYGIWQVYRYGRIPLKTSTWKVEKNGELLCFVEIGLGGGQVVASS